MTWAIDQKLHWTDHYAEYGFAVINDTLSQRFIDAALGEIREMFGHQNLPLNEWTAKNTPLRHNKPPKDLAICSTVYDQPGVRYVIDTMFGSPKEWDGTRMFQVFVTPYDESAKPEVSAEGHIDFVRTPVPIFGSGFVCQVSLVKTEPFSGNITIYPGTHKLIQKALVENPDLQYPEDLSKFLKVEPYEFVAEPGDAIVFHHLVGHAGNNNHAANRSPRLALHCLVDRGVWLNEIDPGDKTLSPWKRSLAHTGGKYRVRQDEREWISNYAKTRTTKPEFAKTVIQ